MGMNLDGIGCLFGCINNFSGFFFGQTNPTNKQTGSYLGGWDQSIIIAQANLNELVNSNEWVNEWKDLSVSLVFCNLDR